MNVLNSLKSDDLIDRFIPWLEENYLVVKLAFLFPSNFDTGRMNLKTWQVDFALFANIWMCKFPYIFVLYSWPH